MRHLQKPEVKSIDHTENGSSENSAVEEKLPPYHIYYELIGEWYVHGIMDGEAIRQQNDENIKAQVFELR
jgi:hypothetical protein